MSGKQYFWLLFLSLVSTALYLVLLNRGQNRLDTWKKQRPSVYLVHGNKTLPEADERTKRGLAWKGEVERHLEEISQSTSSLIRRTNSSEPIYLLRETDSGYYDKVRTFVPDSRTFFFSPRLGAVEDGVLRLRSYKPAYNNCSLVEVRAASKSGRKSSCTQEVNTKIVNISLSALADRRLPAEFGPDRRLNLTHLHVLVNAVVDVNGDVICGQAKLVPNRCLAANASLRDPVRRKGVRTYDQVFTISQFWGYGFFHGTTENLSRLALYLPFLRSNTGIRIHVAAGHPFLPYLGIDSDRLVFGTLRARILYVPAGGSCGRPSYFRIQTLADELRRCGIRTPPERRDLIVVIRRSRRRRWFNEHEAIVAMARRHAVDNRLKVVEYRDDPVPSVPDTMDIFRRALVIIAPHGAGEANIIFSHPGSVLIEGLCRGHKGKWNLCYQHMAKALGLRYYGLVFDKSCKNITAEDIERPLTEYLKLYRNGTL